MDTQLLEIVWTRRGHEIHRVTASIDHTLNPTLSASLLRSIPYQTIQTHALVSGDHLYHICPDPLLPLATPFSQVDRVAAPVGTVFMSQLQHLAVKCGPVTETLPAAPVGRVFDTDLEKLPEVADVVWEAMQTDTPVLVEVRSLGSLESPSFFRRPPLVEDPDVQALLNSLHQDLRNLAVTPPEDQWRLHHWGASSGAGSRNTYMTTLIFVNGETRPMGYASLGALARASQPGSLLDLTTLRDMARDLLGTTSEFLGYCGMERLLEFIREAIRLLDLMSREEFHLVMLWLTSYVNCLNAWNLQLFPWAEAEGLA